MKFLFAMLLAATLTTTALAQDATVPATDGAIAVATRLLDALQADDFAAAHDTFAPSLRTALPQEQLAQIWRALPSQVGALEARGEPRVETSDGYTVAVVPLRFARMTLDARVTVSAAGEATGFFLKPAQAAPPAAVESDFREHALTVGEAPLALGATLTLPDGDSPFPGVVLVHGSGPHDRDETIGPNRPFRDLAQGLAERGVATLRYDKRTKAHPQSFGASFTVDDETVDDAVAALALLAAQPEIDGVYLLGHSLGGAVAPRIAQRAARVDGMVLMAASARALDEIVLDQVRYIAGIDGEVGAQEQANLDSLAKQAASMRAALEDEAHTGSAMLGLPMSYWRDVLAYDGPAVAASLDVPMLILHAGRDYQVTDADLALWTQALGERDDVVVKRYPDLNHLFATGRGKATPQEYFAPATVDARVIADIAAWVKSETKSGANAP